MWNHAQNCPSSGDEDAFETDGNSWQKERIEKSLDLTQYLKYLDQLFGQASSESESSDSDDAERNRTFTEFRQPPVASQPPERSQYTQNHLLPGPSTSSESSNHVNSFQFKHTENFHIESNISSSSLSSIDSGTSSLSLNLSSDTFTETSQGKTDDKALRENSGNGQTQSTLSSSVGGTEEENAATNSGDKDKKSQKKKKSAKNSDDLPRQHKPSSGGKGNNGYKGGGTGGGGAAPGGDSSGGSSGSGGSSSNQSTTSNNGSPGAKGRCRENSLQADSQPEVIILANESCSSDGICPSNTDCIDTASTDLQNVLGISDSNSESLLLNGDLTDSFENIDTFNSSEISCFRLDSLLDSIPEEETSLSDFISLSSSAHSTNSPSTVTQSTNFFSKIAEAAATSVRTYSSNKYSGLLRNPNMNDSSKADGKKRKIENSQFDKSAKLTDKQKQSKIEYFNAKRRKIYINISRKDVIKTQKSRAISFKEGLIIRRKLAHACAHEVRKNQVQSQLYIEEEVEGRHPSRELLRTSVNESFKNPTQDTRLHGLLTLMELFTNKLLDKNIIEVDLLHFDDVEEMNGQIALQNPDSERDTLSILNTVACAAKEHHNLVKLLDMSGLYLPDKTVNGAVETYTSTTHECFLKKHHVAGINWINNLYRKGLNGILADESGLGEKEQVIGFFSHLAESHSLWGPFLIVAPSSSVNIWQQELNRMCPKFKVVSYWGKPQDRKILRQVWEKNCIHTENTIFHIIVTSYPVMVADLKYFSKTKWQYLILDDSQNAITSSTKWMAILSFRCRSKLLLCSDPRLNSISHLCSYLYFIMPSLFDSQKELSEWLLNELESPTTKTKCEIYEDKSATTSRLKVITEAFMLRREMQDVEIEIITPGIDVILQCPLTKRQRQIYAGLLEETDLRVALTCLENCQPQEIRTRVRKALNLSLQLRMTCNHPNLIEECVHSTSFWMDTPLIKLPQLIYQERSIINEPSLNHLFCIFSAFNIYKSLYEHSSNGFSTWSFSRILNLHWKEVEDLFMGGFVSRLNHLVDSHSVLQKIQYDAVWMDNRDSNNLINYPTAMLHHFLSQNKVLSALVFTSLTPYVCTWRKSRKVSVVNSIQYQRLKSRYIFQGNKNTQTISTWKRGFTYPVCPSLEYADFFKCYSSNVYSRGFTPFVSCSAINRQVMMKDNRILISDLVNMIDLDSLNDQNKISIIKENLLYNGSHRFLPEHDRLIGDSGKVMILDDILATFSQAKRLMLLVTYIKSSLRVIEEFLKIRNRKFVLIEDSHKCDIKDDVFIYLMFAHSSVSDFKISVDTVIFFDHDWGIKIEEQKNRLLQKIGHSDSVDCYRLVCSDTIEERMVASFIASTKGRHIVSPTLTTDVSEKSQLSSFPALKSLVAILMDEWHQNRGWTRKPSLVKQKTSLSLPFSLETKSKDIKLKARICKATSSTQDPRSQNGADIDYVSDNEEPHSTSPNCSEDQDLYMDDDDLKVGRCQVEDNFSLSFDEGYMGMSPDSFEDTTIKSDYEENSSPKKPKMGRGAGKRGRPPSRIRLHHRIMCNGSDTFRRGPGRPRSKTMPANQGCRGRRPGRPPLTHKAETISSAQNVFAFYSSTDLELS